MQSDRKDGGPTFPLDARHEGPEGATLRDYFAAHALVGFLAYSPDNANDSQSQPSYHEAARWAYQQADAMLAERRRLPVAEVEAP